jgi:carboxyl-terminal processing protease
MNRLATAAVACGLALAVVHVPSAGAAAATLTQQQADELTASYAYLVTDFYKKVDPQVVLDGARSGLLAMLKTEGVKNPTVDTGHATTDDVGNVRELQRQVTDAITAYSSPKLPATKITYAAINGLIGSVKDKYTVFLDPKAFAELNAGLDGTSFGGVGLSYSIDDQTKNIRVENVIIDGPSDRAGIRADDQINTINGQAVKEIIGTAPIDVQQSRIQKLLRGDPGTRVTLGIVRTSGPAAITVTRETIKPPSVFAKLLPDGVGYAQLSVFGQNTGSELTAALNRLESQGAKAYVLDLRYNGGGYLNAAIDVSSKFIASGPIVTVQSRAGRSTEYDAENTAIAPRPLAVLVNAYTASASEITAGAIEDSGVGTLIGTKTYGKGVVQTIFPLRDGSAVKITTARYFTPAGHDINTVGIQPQILAEIPKDVKIRPGYPNEDPQLQRALDFLEQKLAQVSQR